MTMTDWAGAVVCVVLMIIAAAGIVRRVGDYRRGVL